MKAVILVFALLLPVSSLGAEEDIGADTVEYVLPKSKYEACLLAKEFIRAKENMGIEAILDGSENERFLENLVRVCADLPIYTKGNEIKEGQNKEFIRLPNRNLVFKLHPNLIRKLMAASNARKLNVRNTTRFERKYGPITEIPFLVYCRIETAEYLENIGKERRANGLTRLFNINSAFRSAAYQEWLQRRNPNAIPIGTATGSSHPTLATVDIGYKTMSKKERNAMERRLAEDDRNGLIQATKEKHQVVYHVMVFPKKFFENLALAEWMLQVKEMQVAAR